MSSDEMDEFFDASDVTPAKPSLPKPHNAEDEVNKDLQTDSWCRLEEEERRLQEEERLYEERKRLIQQKKEELARQKEEMDRQAMEAKRKAEEGEIRRQRLDEMRKIMQDDSASTARPPPKPPRLNAEDNEAAGNRACDRDDSSTDEENNASTEPRLDDHSKTLDNNLQSVGDHEKLQTKKIPELVLDDSAVEMRDVAEANLLIEQEPDIIQSTKASSLERVRVPPARPVAPPRRKKKRPQSGVEEQDDEGLDIEIPSSTAYNLMRNLERSLSLSKTEAAETSLNLRSATMGRCFVQATEDASAKAQSVAIEMEEQAESREAAESSDNGSASQLVEAPYTESREMFTVKLELKDRGNSVGEVEEVREIPLSMKRPRSNSGTRYLTDEEILESVMVLNLDTGEKIPLCHAEEKLPRCINPLSLHIMRRTKEYSSDSSLHKYLSEEDSSKNDNQTNTTKTIGTVKPASSGKRRKKIKRLIGKTVMKIKSVADEVIHGQASESEEEDLQDDRKLIKIRAANSFKGPYDFDLLVPMQDLVEHVGPVWTMEFSQCGRLLATGGQDCILRVWAIKDHSSYFDDMRNKYSESSKAPSPAPSQDSLSSQAESHQDPPEGAAASDDDDLSPFMKRPFCVYKGHTADLLDISWSKNYFILSSSMDKTVRLWHISRKECLCCFQHIDFVTAIAFHPKDDRYFLSGSLDGKLRLWNIPDKKVALWNEISGQTKLITAANFCQNGNLAVVGTYDGRCIFYTTEQLKYNTQINVKSTRGKNKKGRKITGIEPYPGENKVLVTSNDSRLRIYDLQDKTLTCKYKGCANNSSQIKASFSHDGKYIVSGSEDRSVYIWKTNHEFYKFSSARRDRNDYWESIKAHSAVVTSAIFAPHPRLILKPQFEYLDSDEQDVPAVRGEVLVSADYTGVIKVFINKFKPGSG